MEDARESVGNVVDRIGGIGPRRVGEVGEGEVDAELAEVIPFGSEHHAAYRGVLAVGAEHEVVPSGAAGLESDVNVFAIVGEGLDRVAEADRRGFGERLGEDTHEVLAQDFDVVGVARLRQRDSGHRLAPAVDEAGLLGHPDPLPLDLPEQSHPVHGRNRIAADVDGRSREPEVVGALDDRHLVAADAQLECAGESGDAGSRNEDAHDV